MTRSVLLASGIYPLIIRYWLENLKLWEHRIDKVYIAVEKKTDLHYLSYLKEKTKDNPKIVIVENCNPWPDSYADAFKASKEDLFIIMHDDTYIYDPNIVDEYFVLAEEGKVVTPLHEMYSPKPKIETMLRQKYPGIFPLVTRVQKGNIGSWEGFSFLLYLVFISRKNMDKTTLNFNGWESPTYKESLGAADTGFQFMLDLLDKKVEIYPIPRYDPENTGGPYIHLQNIGNTIPSLLNDEQPLDPNWDMNILKSKLDWIDKFMSVDDYHEIPEFKEKVVKRIEYLRSLI